MVRRAARVRRPSPLRCLVEVEKILGPQGEERERGGRGIPAMAKVVTPPFTGRTNLLAGRKDVGFPVGIGLSGSLLVVEVVLLESPSCCSKRVV